MPFALTWDHKLVGQGYDGAATFAGEHNGVQRRIRAHAAHSIYIHCACHRLQLASIHAAKKSPEVKKMFGMMGNLWKLFYYSPKKAESLKEIQSILKLPELKIVKPSDTGGFHMNGACELFFENSLP